MGILHDPYNIVLAGVGGQGIKTAAKVLATAAWKEGYRTCLGEVYGLSQRGGSVTSHLRLSETFEPPPLIPENSAHVIVGLEPAETLRALKKYGNKNTVVVVNPQLVLPLEARAGRISFPSCGEVLSSIRGMVENVVEVPTTTLCEQKDESALQNSVMLGALLGLNHFPIRLEKLEKAMQEFFQGSILEKNITVLERGYHFLNNGVK